MIKAVHFENFKVLRDATLPLGRFTLIVGPNGSGKSTALKALELLGNPGNGNVSKLATAGSGNQKSVGLQVEWAQPYAGYVSKFVWAAGSGLSRENSTPRGASKQREQDISEKLGRIRVFSFDARAMAAPVDLDPLMELASDGSNLAGVLDRLRDT